MSQVSSDGRTRSQQGSPIKIPLLQLLQTRSRNEGMSQANQCRTCKGKHHTFVHRDAQTQQPPQAAQSSSNATVTTCVIGEDTTQVLLSTALVKVNGQVIRVFLDSGSQASLITEACVKSLGLKKQKTYVSISGVASTSVGSARSQTSVSFTSCVRPESVKV